MPSISHCFLRSSKRHSGWYFKFSLESQFYKCVVKVLQYFPRNFLNLITWEYHITCVDSVFNFNGQYSVCPCNLWLHFEP